VSSALAFPITTSCDASLAPERVHFLALCQADADTIQVIPTISGAFIICSAIASVENSHQRSRDAEAALPDHVAVILPSLADAVSVWIFA